jgi:ribonuclease P protein component
MPPHTFPPDRKLRRRSEFQQVFDSGRRAHGRYLTIIALVRDGQAARLGIVASRKLGGAVVRNRAKRLIRDVFRVSERLPPADLVVIPKQALLSSAIAELRRDFDITLRRCLSNK